MKSGEDPPHLTQPEGQRHILAFPPDRRHRFSFAAAISLVGAGGVAAAAPMSPVAPSVAGPAVVDHNWEAVALCETFGDWQNDGSYTGFYGGLNLTMSQWEAFGGYDFAHRPDLATPDEQKEIANKILEALGPTMVVPACGKYIK